ncbi:MAG: glycosyltransferase [Candidatus Sumerlaeaceae bacterium]|nr:glycosyltransferase [Candidatus Sumerlaeaceae bacterium]
MISVVTTTYNRAALLPRAVESLLRQTWTNWEQIILDDGSTDGTAAVAEDYCRRDSRLRYSFQENTGLSGARNAGIALARGELITFLDSDDEYAPEHLRLRAEFMAGHPEVDMIHGGVTIVGGPDVVPDKFDSGRTIAIADCFVGGTFFMRSHVPTGVGGFRQPDYGDDHDFIQRAAGKYQIARVDFPTYIYHRDSPDSMCNILARDRE